MVIHDYDAFATVESNLFRQLIMDAYAYIIWPFMGFTEFMGTYSEYDPAWILAHSARCWIQEMQAEGAIYKVEDLLRMNFEIEWVLEETIFDIFLWLVPQTMAHYNIGATIAVVEEYRCFEDFDFRPGNQKTDFYRKLYHPQPKHP